MKGLNWSELKIEHYTLINFLQMLKETAQKHLERISKNWTVADFNNSENSRKRRYIVVGDSITI